MKVGAVILLSGIGGMLLSACSPPSTEPRSATAQTALGPNLTITTYASTTTSSTTCVEPTIPVGTPRTPVTGCPGITLPTVVVHRPSPYDPGYHTVGQLVHDSLFIVLATLGPATSCSQSKGSPVTCYPIQVQQDLGGTDPRIDLAVTAGEVQAAGLDLDGTYVIFWGAETAPLDTVCIVGGVRGIMRYDATTGLVTRLDHTAHSRIPRTQTLNQLKGEIQQVEAATARAPLEVPPAPVCSPSATGLPAK